MFEWIKSGFGPAIQIALLLACVFQPIALPTESVAVRYREGVGHGFVVLRTPDGKPLKSCSSERMIGRKIFSVSMSSSPRWMDKQPANCSLSQRNFRYRYLFQTRKETPMKRLRYLGLVTLLAVMTCNTSGQMVRQKDRVISGNANLSKLIKEGTEAVKDDKLREVLLDSSVNAVILQDRTQGGATSGDYGYWILYAKGRDTNLKAEKISKEDYEWLINFSDRVDKD
jgi:hypothetical protein